MADTSVRKFAMTYGELIGICSSVYGFMQRDTAEFLLYGVTALIISDFNDALEEFIGLPQDQELEADEKNATLAKNDLANELRIVLRTYNTRAKLVFKENTGTYGRFYKKDLARLNDRDLYLFAELVKESAEEYLTQLATAGLTQDMIDDLATLNTNFYNAMFQQSQAIANRDNAANLRVKKANELYDLLVKYCDVGKTIWYETNEAKYNDYVIYEKSPGGLTAPTNLKFSLGTMNLTWDSVTNATSYQLEADNGAGYVEIYAGEDTIFAYTPADGKTLYRVRARNANGFGEFSTVLEQYYYSTLPRPDDLTVEELGGYQFKLYWPAVPTATRYHIYQSVVEVGMPENIYSLLATVEALEFVHIFEANRYTYLKYTASNDYQPESDFSRVNLVATPE